MSRWELNVEPGIEMVDPDQLLANPWNYRIHTERQRLALQNSLDDLGWLRPVLVNRLTQHIVDGHGRVEEADKAGEQVPVQYCVLSEEQEREAIVSLDTIVGMAGTDKDKLQELSETLKAKGLVIWQELLRMLRGAGARLSYEPENDPGPQVDEAAELERKWGTALGQTWFIPSASVPGHSHRLVVGDCTKPGVLAQVAVIDGEDRRARCLWTDPPYGVNYHGTAGEIENDEAEGLYALLAAAFGKTNYLLGPGAAVYICAPAGPPGHVFRNVLEAFAPSWHWHQTLVWVKSVPVLGHSDYHYQHEDVLYGWKQGGERVWNGERLQRTVFDEEVSPSRLGKRELIALVKELRRLLVSSVRREDKPTANVGHPTVKPTALIRSHLRNSTNERDLVLDPFAGSGSTMVACEQTGRLFAGSEISPRYAAVSLQRAQDMCLEPRRIGT